MRGKGSCIAGQQPVHERLGPGRGANQKHARVNASAVFRDDQINSCGKARYIMRGAVAAAFARRRHVALEDLCRMDDALHGTSVVRDESVTIKPKAPGGVVQALPHQVQLCQSGNTRQGLENTAIG